MKKHISLLASGLLVAIFVLSGSSAYAQTTGTTSTSGTTGTYTTTGTVGAPNTGAGGSAPLNIAILLSSGMIAAGGSLYLHNKKYAR